MRHFFYLFDFLDEKDFAVGYWDSDDRNYYEWNSVSEHRTLMGCVCQTGHVFEISYNPSYEHIPGHAFLLQNPQNAGEYTIYRIHHNTNQFTYEVIGSVNRRDGHWEIWKYWKEYYGFSFVGTSKVPDVEATSAFLLFNFDSLPHPKDVYLEGNKISISRTSPCQIPGPVFQYPLDLRFIRTFATDAMYKVSIKDYPNSLKSYLYSNYEKKAEHVLGFLDKNTSNFYELSYFGSEQILGSINSKNQVFNCAYNNSLDLHSPQCIGYLNDEQYVIRINPVDGTHEYVGFLADYNGGYDVMAYIPEQAGYTWVGFSSDSIMAGAAFILLQPRPMMEFAATGEYWWNENSWKHGYSPKSGLSLGQHLF